MKIFNNKQGKLDAIEDNGGRYKYYVWKNGNHVDGDLYINDFSDAVTLVEENDADEIEVAIWYSEEDFNKGAMADKFVTIWEK